MITASLIALPTEDLFFRRLVIIKKSIMKEQDLKAIFPEQPLQAHMPAIRDAFFDSAFKKDAAEMDDNMKIMLIEKHFREIMLVLGLDLQDDSLKDTPKRVAKMYVKEIFSGLNPANKPSITLFENQYGYNQMLVEKNIAVNSHCEHHFVPITGKAHIAYFSSGKVIGLSKLNRIVQYCSSRPQVQERLTVEVAALLKEVLDTENVAVLIDAVHHCVSSRGIRDVGSSTITTEFSGKFVNNETKNEFLKYAGY